MSFNSNFSHVIIAALISLFFIGISLEFVQNDLIIFLIGVSSFFLMLGFFNKDNEQSSSKESVSSPQENEKGKIPWWETKGRPYSFYFTHEEDALDSIQTLVESHPKVKSATQDSGFWYSNGETGPEWFSMIVACKVEESEEIKKFIQEKLKEKNFSYEHINFVGSYN